MLVQTTCRDCVQILRSDLIRVDVLSKMARHESQRGYHGARTLLTNYQLPEARNSASDEGCFGQMDDAVPEFYEQSVQLRRTTYSNNVCHESTSRRPGNNEPVNCATALVLL
jgi:hypothetical protein